MNRPVPWRLSTRRKWRRPVRRWWLVGALCQLFAAGMFPGGLVTFADAAEHPGDALRQAPHAVIGIDGQPIGSERYQFTCEMVGEFLRPRLTNVGETAWEVAEVILFDWAHGLPGTCGVYGEGFTMLSQTGGTLARPEDLGQFTDRQHYRLAEAPGQRTVYGVLNLALPVGESLLLGFTSCHRFVGRFHVGPERIQVAVATEGKRLLPGESWALEELLVAHSSDRNALQGKLAARLNTHHPRQPCPELPTGWCSWYCFGPRVTAENVMENLRVIDRQLPQLKYIQIDDGYQPWMGDWLDTGQAFGGGAQSVLEQIRGAGFEPALWVAPFIASPQSKLFTEHPDWFVQDHQGHPLRSDTFTFGGWRLGPWYMLDGTHPAAQQYLTQVFRALREQWGCTYFKLDANAWGAFAQGRRYADEATSVEAYRQGMAAIRRGAGDAFLLGCNHPLWPSIGEIHGSRSSRDIQRSWEAYRGAARENLMRNWQNNSLWWNDPDCLVLGGKPTAAEESFHIVATYASGGMLLSGDDLTRANDQQLDVIRQCLRNPGVAARFENDRLEIGRIRGTDHTVVALLNWGDQQAARLVEFDQPARAHDLLTGEDLGTPTSPLRLVLPGRSGRLLKMTPLRSVSQ